MEEMDIMELYDLGLVPWLDSQLIYHALPRVDREGLILLAPAEPYVCIGYHQDVEQEVDLDYCRQHGIPVFRREVGGGGVYLDGQQLFYQLVLHRDNPLALQDKGEFYRILLQPVVETYNDLGIPARYKPVNDIITAQGRKISGNGAAEIGDYRILVGNLIMDFDYETMVRVLKVPDEKFRDKIYATLRENLSTIKRELGTVPPLADIKRTLIGHFQEILGPLTPSELPQEVRDKAEELKPRFLSDEWLYKKGKRVPGREVKIAAGVHVVQRAYKAPGGLIRVIAEFKDERIAWLSLSGDFFFYPADKLETLEEALVGVPLAEVEEAVSRFYAEQGIESPGVTPTDWARAIGSR